MLLFTRAHPIDGGITRKTHSTSSRHSAWDLGEYVCARTKYNPCVMKQHTLYMQVKFPNLHFHGSPVFFGITEAKMVSSRLPHVLHCSTSPQLSVSSPLHRCSAPSSRSELEMRCLIPWKSTKPKAACSDGPRVRRARGAVGFCGTKPRKRAVGGGM